MRLLYPLAQRGLVILLLSSGVGHANYAPGYQPVNYAVPYGYYPQPGAYAPMAPDGYQYRETWQPRPYEYQRRQILVPGNRKNAMRPPVKTQQVAKLQQKQPAGKVKGLSEALSDIVEAKDNKQVFFDKLKPLVESENQRLLRVRNEVGNLSERLSNGQVPTDLEQNRLRQLARQYRVEGDPVELASVREKLLQHIDIIPASLALAQAANESAWGTSRFAREGNNLFGIWTYDQDKGIVPKGREEGKTHLVRKFDSLADSVSYYMHTLNSHPAYEEMRRLRAEQRTKQGPLQGLQLANGLEKYSAKGKDYIALIQQIIRKNNLASLDIRPSHA